MKRSVLVSIITSSLVLVGCSSRYQKDITPEQLIKARDKGQKVTINTDSLKNDIENIQKNSILFYEPKDNNNYFITLATSGGGHRAAAFTAGVMLGLDNIENEKFDVEYKDKYLKEFYSTNSHIKKDRNDSILDNISIISSVSGSSIATAYYTLAKKSFEDKNLSDEIILRNFLNRLADNELGIDSRNPFDWKNIFASLLSSPKLINKDEQVAYFVDKNNSKKHLNKNFYETKILDANKVNNQFLNIPKLSNVYDMNFSTDEKAKELRLVLNASNISLGGGFYFVPEEMMAYGISLQQFKDFNLSEAVYSSMAYPVLAPAYIIENDHKYAFKLKSIPYFHLDRYMSERLSDIITAKFIKIADGGLWDNSGADFLIRWYEKKQKFDEKIQTNSDNGFKCVKYNLNYTLDNSKFYLDKLEDLNYNYGHLMIVVDNGKISTGNSLSSKEGYNNFEYMSEIGDMLIDRSSQLVLERLSNKIDEKNLRAFLLLKQIIPRTEKFEDERRNKTSYLYSSEFFEYNSLLEKPLDKKEKLQYKIHELLNEIILKELYKNLTSKNKKDLNSFAVKLSDLEKMLDDYQHIKSIKLTEEDKHIIKRIFEVIKSSTKIVYISMDDIENSIAKNTVSNIKTKMFISKGEASSLFELGATVADSKREEIRTMLYLMPSQYSKKKN